MGSMKGKQAKIDAAFGRLADMIPSGNLLASADPVGFLDTVAAELKDLRAENVKLKGTVSIKQDRVNDLEKALRDTLRQLERAISGMPTEEQIATLTKGDYIARKVWEWLCHAKAIGYVPWVLDTKSPSYDPAKAAAQAARDELLAELEEVIATVRELG